MKKELIKKIEIPEGVSIELKGSEIVATSKGNKNLRDFDLRNLNLEKKENEIILSEKKASKNDKRMMNTIASHIDNMIKGVLNPYEYKLKVCFSHFPITVEVKGKEAIIKNFLGERSTRKLKLPEGVKVQVDKEIITVTSSDKEIAGQAAANFENITRIPNRDRRIFQDGIFITSKCGEDI
jgi:large subunit ribosomal protein L6